MAAWGRPQLRLLLGKEEVVVIRPPAFGKLNDNDEKIKKDVIYFPDPDQADQGVHLDAIVDTKGLTWLRHAQCMQYQKYKWCPHVQQVYTENARPAPDAHQDALPVCIGLQVFYRNWLAVPLYLPFKDGDKLTEVFVLSGDVSATLNKKSGMKVIDIQCDKKESIGYIERGVQGRYTLRGMVVEWLEGLPYLLHHQGETCTFSAHVPGSCWLEHLDDVDPVPEKSKLMRDAFHLLDRGMCVACDENTHIDNPWEP